MRSCSVVVCLTHTCSILPLYLCFIYCALLGSVHCLNYPSSGFARVQELVTLPHFFTYMMQLVLSCLAAYIGYLSFVHYYHIWQIVSSCCWVMFHLPLMGFNVWTLVRSHASCCDCLGLASWTWGITLGSEYKTCCHMQGYMVLNPNIVHCRWLAATPWPQIE